MTNEIPGNQVPQHYSGPMPQPYSPSGYPPAGYPPPTYAYQPPPPKKTPIWPWVLGGIVLVIFLGVGGCVAFVGTVATSIHNEATRQVTVTYSVKGSANSASITYSGKGFNSAQETGASLPWTKSVTIDGLGKTIMLTATNGFADGTVTCEISANGKVLAQQTSSGAFATASCLANAGDA